MDKKKLEKYNKIYNSERIQYLLNTFNPNYNYNILKMNNKFFGNIQKRFEVEDYIKSRYNEYTLPEKIKLKEIKNGVYNLKEQYKFNIFYNLEILIPNNFDLSQNILFSIKNKEQNICSISLFGCNLFCYQKRETYRTTKYLILPIYLFECFEKKYIDVDDFDTNIYLTIEGKNIENITLYCSAIFNYNKSINRYYIEYIMVEKNDYLTQNAWINNNEKNNFIYFNNSDDFILDINCKYFCQLYYFSLFYENYPEIPQIKSINVQINKHKIPFNSSKIIYNNNENFHYVSLFPDSNTDLLKNKNVFAFNFNNSKNLKNIIKLKSPIKDNINAIFGFLTYNVIIYNDRQITIP